MLIIQENVCCEIGNFKIEIETYLGQFADVHYFQVNLKNDDNESEKQGLLRVGSTNGGLFREMELRKVLENSKMISELLAEVTKLVCVSSRSSLLEEIQEKPNFSHKIDDSLEPSWELHFELEPESEYLEEIVFDDDVADDLPEGKLILLTYLPNEEETLETWLKKENSLETSLSVAIQVCQFFRFIYQRKWCFVQIFPKFIQLGTPIQFFDLTGAYPADQELASSFIADYCAPEITYNHCSICEEMSSYTVGCLLYHTIHHQLPTQSHIDELNIKPIPLIYQILKLCLSPIPEERLPLTQLLNLLMEIRQSMRTPQIEWEVASNSTVGLSTSRLQNEDSYGVRRHYLSNSEPLFMGIVADGMGGMAKGEVASDLAVQTVIEADIPAFTNSDKAAEWLIDLVHQANERVTDNVPDGGTTISLVMAIGQKFMIAHVGDSRIYLLRKKQICQLSEDHSMVSMLLASGQITYEESLNHPDRNLLTKSLGSKRTLSTGYVQDLSRYGEDSSMPLQHEDIVIICSDGVWDLVPAVELADFFIINHLQSAVDATIQQVLARGACDNATILAFKYCLKNFS